MTKIRIPSLRRNAGYSFVLSLVRFGLAMISIPVLIRSLGLPGYGVWVVLLAILGLTSILQLGLAPAVTFQVARTNMNVDEIAGIMATSFWLFSAVGSLVGMILVAGAHPIALLVFRAADQQVAETTLPILGVATYLQFMRQWIMAVEAGLQRYDLQAWADGAGTVVLYAGLVLLALLGNGIRTLFIWWGLASLGTLLGHWYLWRVRTGISAPLRLRCNVAVARPLLGFALRQWPAQLGGSLFGQLDRVVINVMLGPAAAGLYAVGASVAVRINEFSASPVQVVGPAIAAAHSLGRQDDVYRRAESLNRLLAYGLAATIMLASEVVARLVVPVDATTMAAVLRIMAVCYGLYSVNAVAYYAAQGLGRPSINARWSLAAGLAFIVSLMLLSEVSGIKGAAWANLAYALTLGINVEVMALLGMRWTFGLFSAGKLLLSLATCFLVTSVAMPVTDNVVTQFAFGATAVAAGGAWILNDAMRLGLSRTSKAGA